MPGRIIKRNPGHPKLDSRGALKKVKSELKNEKETLNSRKAYYDINKEIEPNSSDMHEMPGLINKSEKRMSKLKKMKSILENRLKRNKLTPVQESIVNQYGKINKKNHKKIIKLIKKDIEDLEKRARTYRSASDVDTARDLEERIEELHTNINEIEQRYK